MSRYQIYISKKVGWYLVTFFIALLLNFILPRLVEGNPIMTIVAQMGSDGMTDANALKRVYETFMTDFGLDKPVYEQFFIFVGNLFKGDLGVSFLNFPRPVTEIIASALPWTLGLQIPAICIGWILGNKLGALTAYKKGIYEKTVFPVSLFINALPYFAFALILLYVFGVVLGWFPVGGAYARALNPTFSWRFISSVLYHYVLPFSSLMLIMIGGQAIGMRSMAIYELNSDYVLYSKLMGLPDKKVSNYVFRNAMLPQLSGLSHNLGMMITGALVCEIVFAYPGLGTTMYKAIVGLDYPLISGCTLVVTIIVLIANFAVDILYGIVDPRIKAAQMEEG